MTDTPDLRTLAAEAIYAAVNEAAQRDPQPFVQDLFQYVVPAVLAAVLPAHRRQVLAELADELRREAELMHAPVRAMYPESSSAYALVWDDVAEHVADLASAGPETAPRPRHDDETAPAVPEATPAPAEGDTALGADQIPEQVYLDAAEAHVKALFSHRPQLSDATLKQSKRPGFRAAVAAAYRAGQAAVPDGPRTLQLPDDRERAKAAIHQPLHDLNVRIVGLQVGDCHCNLIAEVVLDALTDPERDNPKETP